MQLSLVNIWLICCWLWSVRSRDAVLGKSALVPHMDACNLTTSQSVATVPFSSCMIAAQHSVEECSAPAALPMLLCPDWSVTAVL